jgi:hypothetical protein
LTPWSATVTAALTVLPLTGTSNIAFCHRYNWRTTSRVSTELGYLHLCRQWDFTMQFFKCRKSPTHYSLLQNTQDFWGWASGEWS